MQHHRNCHILVLFVCLFLDQWDSVKDLVVGVGIRLSACLLADWLAGWLAQLGQMVSGNNSTEDLDTTRH